MSNESSSYGAKKAQTTVDSELTKRELERQMERTRESLAETVGEIKETVEQEYQSVRQTVSGILDYREQFQKEPLVWSLGALSAGFALGYTVGYAHKNTKSGKQSQLLAFAGSMVDELSTMGQDLVIPVLSEKIRELFGFDFSDLLRDIEGAKKSHGKKGLVKRRIVKAGTKKQAGKKKAR
jgi:phage regulator Rha-like protein